MWIELFVLSSLGLKCCEVERMGMGVGMGVSMGYVVWQKLEMKWRRARAV